MRYNIQEVIERLQKFQKENSDTKIVSDDELLKIATPDVHWIENHVKRLQNEVDRLIIEFDDYKKDYEDLDRRRWHKDYNHDKELKLLAGKYRIPDREMSMYFFRTILEVSHLNIVTRKTLYDWAKKGIVRLQQVRYYTEEKFIDLRELLNDLKTIQERKNVNRK